MQEESAKPPYITDTYGQLKFPDKVAAGEFANAVLIRHTMHEFVLDFLCDLYPRATVTARVFISATRTPEFVEGLDIALQQYRRRPHAGAS